MCACLRPIHTNVCPNCGFVAKPVNKVFTVDGELHELRKGKNTNRVEVYGMFKQICIDRGNAPGRAWHLSTEYFKQKPISSEYNSALPCPPSCEILRFEKSRRIAYAKGKARSPVFTIPVGGFYQSRDPEDVPF